MKVLALLLVMCASSVCALAVQPDEVLDDPALEERARALSAGLRCLVCQNQSIDDSDAPLARDLRILLRERLTAGDSDEEIEAFLVSRYGEFVLLKPPLTGHTALLWFAPFALVLAAMFFLLRTRRSRLGAEAPLDPGETERVKRLLNPDKRD